MPSTFTEQATTDPQASTEGQVSPAPKQEPKVDQQTFLIVGERAFASAEDVKTKIVNADRHIGDIETENAILRTQLEEANSQVAASKSLEEVLRSKDSNMDGVLSQEQIEALVSNKVTSINASDISNANRITCMDKAEAAYGENYIVKMIEKAKVLGLDMKTIDKMAEDNPKLFMNTFIPSTGSVTPPSSHTSTINTSNFQQVPEDNDIKPVMGLSNKERTAQLIRQLEALKQN